MREFFWIGEVKYPGKDAFWFGAVVAIGEEDARQRLEREWSRISIHRMPDIVAVHKGRMLIELDKEEGP